MNLLAVALLLASPAAPGPTAEPAPPEGAANRHRLAHVALVGPLERVRLIVEPMGETIVHAELLAGERCSLAVPLPVWGATEDLLPQIELLGSGRASFVGWDVGNEVADSAWAALPRGLRQRPRPAPPAPRQTPLPAAALFVAAAALAAGWSLRARPARSLLVSAVAAVCMVPLVSPRSPTPSLRVLEGDGASGAWMVVDAARGRIEAPARAAADPLPLRVECQPARTRLTYEVQSGGPGVARWTLRGSGQEPRCALFVLSPLALAVDSTGVLGAGSNDLIALEQGWLRAADGSGWEALGAWPLGVPLPPAERPQDPPGSLNPALPLGQRVLVGRLAAGAGEGAGAGGEALWLRLVGL